MKDLNKCYSFAEFKERYFNKNKIKDSNKNTASEENIMNKKEKFIKEKKLICPICKQNLTFIKGTNIFTCTNEKCKGISHTVTLADGTTKTFYKEVFRTITDSQAKYADKIF